MGSKARGEGEGVLRGDPGEVAADRISHQSAEAVTE